MNSILGHWEIWRSADGFPEQEYMTYELVRRDEKLVWAFYGCFYYPEKGSIELPRDFKRREQLPNFTYAFHEGDLS